jgi:hypothetical protein
MPEPTEELAFDPENMSVNQNPLQCFHYHSLGHRCGSPAVRGEYFCYHHRNSLKPAPVIIFPTQPFELPHLTDRDSVLRAADEVASRIAANSLDLRRAKAILSAIYIAAAHLPPEAPLAALPSPQPELRATETILEIEIEHTREIGASLEPSPADAARALPLASNPRLRNLNLESRPSNLEP